MGTCASVNANQVHPLAEAPEVHLDTAVFTRPSPSQTTTVTTKTLELRDATPQNLKQVFELDFYPKEIIDKAINLTKIHQGPPSQPFWNLQVNAEYEVGGAEAEEDLYTETLQRSGMKSGDEVHLDTAVFTRPSASQKTSVTTKTLELRDATPQNLKQVFNLDFYPKEITDKATNLTKVHQGPPSQPFWNLQVNAEYEVGGEEAEEDLYMDMLQRPRMKPGDVQRALICAEAAYLSDLPDTDPIQQFFKDERNLHNFERVSVSRHGSVGYILAETQDREEVFVAFKGTSKFEDVMVDLSFWQEGAGQSGDSHNSGVGGKYHSGFMRLAFLIPAHRILEEYSNSRIVVCGHSLGGAVAHIVALNMMVCLLKKGQSVDNVKSIAFGTPYFGNYGALEYAEENNLSPRLLTIVNEKDPVPYILRLAQTVQCLGHTALKKADKYLAKAKPVVLGILGVLTASGILSVGTLFKAASVTFHDIPAQIEKCKRMLGLWGLAARELDSLYVPLGWYLCISCSTSKAGGGSLWRRSLLTHPGAVQYTAPDVRDWKEEDFQCHRVSNYRRTFFQIARKTTYRDDEATPPSDVIITDAIFPARVDNLRVDVLTEEVDSETTKKCQVVIDGDNLDFLARPRDKPILELPVEDGKFVVVFMSRQRVVLQCEVRSDSLTEVATVVVRTHFQEVTAKVDIKEVTKLQYEVKEGGPIKQVAKAAVTVVKEEAPGTSSAWDKFKSYIFGVKEKSS